MKDKLKYRDTFFLQDTTLLPKKDSAETTVGNRENTVELQVPLSKLRGIQVDTGKTQKDTVKQEAVPARTYYSWYRLKRKDTANVFYETLGTTQPGLYDRLQKDPFSSAYYLNYLDYKKHYLSEDKPVFIEKSKNQLYEEVRGKVVNTIKPNPINKKINIDWITYFIIFFFLVIIWSRMMMKKYFTILFNAVFNYGSSNSIYKETNNIIQKAFFLLNINFIGVISIFIFQVLRNFGISVSGIDPIELLGLVASGFILLQIFRFTVSRFVGHVFLKQKAFREYLFNVNINNMVIGIMLFPMVITLQFITPEFVDLLIIFAFIIIGILYFMQLFRAFEIFAKKKVSLLYMILYLCAFEFVPFLLLYKFLQGTGI